MTGRMPMTVADRWTLFVVHVDNDGVSVDYLASIRAALLAEGFESWMESPGVGYWRGRREEGTTITVYLPAADGTHENARRAEVFHQLRAIAQVAQPDQEVVFVACEPGSTIHPPEQLGPLDRVTRRGNSRS